MTIIQIMALLACLFAFIRSIFVLLHEVRLSPDAMDSEVAIKNLVYMMISGLFIGGLVEMLTA